MTDKEKVEAVDKIIKMAEEWAKEQLMPESQITASALRDIRRIIRKCIS